LAGFPEGFYRTLGVLGFSAVLLLFSVGLQPAHALGGVIQCTGALLGINEVPANTSTATGTITFTFDQSTSTSTWTGTFSGLSALATAAHIHSPAPPGSNAAVQVTLTGFPVGTTSGSFTGSSTTINTRTAAEFANDLLTGMAYANIHTTAFPGGEIRGQLICHIAASVPEFSGALGALAIAALLLPIIAVLRRHSLVYLR